MIIVKAYYEEILGKKTNVIAEAITLSEVNTDTSNQRDDENIFLGFVTRQTLTL